MACLVAAGIRQLVVQAVGAVGVAERVVGTRRGLAPRVLSRAAVGLVGQVNHS